MNHLLFLILARIFGELARLSMSYIAPRTGNIIRNHRADRYAILCAQHKLGDFDRACALEVTARAQIAAGDLDAARAALAKSRAIADTLTDQDEIDVMQRDFADIEQRLASSDPN